MVMYKSSTMMSLFRLFKWAGLRELPRIPSLLPARNRNRSAIRTVKAGMRNQEKEGMANMNSRFSDNCTGIRSRADRCMRTPVTCSNPSANPSALACK